MMFRNSVGGMLRFHGEIFRGVNHEILEGEHRKIQYRYGLCFGALLNFCNKEQEQADLLHMSCQHMTYNMILRWNGNILK